MNGPLPWSSSPQSLGGLVLLSLSTAVSNFHVLTISTQHSECIPPYKNQWAQSNARGIHHCVMIFVINGNYNTDVNRVFRWSYTCWPNLLISAGLVYQYMVAPVSPQMMSRELRILIAQSFCSQGNKLHQRRLAAAEYMHTQLSMHVYRRIKTDSCQPKERSMHMAHFTQWLHSPVQACAVVAPM